MRYFILTGEASGDVHGGNLIRSIILQDPSAEISGWGGENMKNAGATVTMDYKHLAFMGFVEVLLNLFKIFQFFKKCKQDILRFNPDVIVLIDYPGFNMRIMKWAKLKGFKVVYYITPQVWAWKKNRVYALDKYTDKLLVILPFEEAFFNKFGIHVQYVGHPLIEVVDPLDSNITYRENSVIIPRLALLPGSRKQEVTKILPIMLHASKSFQGDVIIAGVNSLDKEMYQAIIDLHPHSDRLEIVFNKTYEVLSNSTVAWVSSGTATLETALFKVPQIVMYKGSNISVALARWLIKVPYISLVNLILNTPLVPELIQDKANLTNISAEMEKIARDRSRILEGYEDLRKLLGSGKASNTAANEIISIAYST